MGLKRTANATGGGPGGSSPCGCSTLWRPVFAGNSTGGSALTGCDRLNPDSPGIASDVSSRGLRAMPGSTEMGGAGRAAWTSVFTSGGPIKSGGRPVGLGASAAATPSGGRTGTTASAGVHPAVAITGRDASGDSGRSPGGFAGDACASALSTGAAGNATTCNVIGSLGGAGGGGRAGNAGIDMAGSGSPRRIFFSATSFTSPLRTSGKPAEARPPGFFAPFPPAESGAVPAGGHGAASEAAGGGGAETVTPKAMQMRGQSPGIWFSAG